MDVDMKAVVGRINEHMTRCGCTQARLAHEAGLSTTQMSRTMNGLRTLTAGELGSIADALGTSASSLLGQPDHATRLSVAARLGAAEHDSALAGPFRRAQALLELRELLDHIVTRPDTHPRPRLDIPTTSHYKAAGEQLATRLRTALDLPHQPIDDLEDFARTFGLDSSTQPLPTNLHGLLVAATTDLTTALVGGASRGGSDAETVAVALVNGNDTLGRRRFTLAHELGHLLFGDSTLYIADYADPPRGKANLPELRADTFAAHLLAPTAGLQQVARRLSDDQRGTQQWATELVVQASMTYGVSVQGGVYRANTERLIDDAMRDRLLARGARQLMADAGQPHETSLFAPAGQVEPPNAMLAQALHAYQSGMLGLAPLATLYDTNDVRGLQEELVAAGWAPSFEQGHQP